MRVLSIVVVFFICSLTGHAQRLCSTDNYIKNHFVPEPRVEQGRSQLPSIPARDTTSNEVIIIPVVVHVLFNNTAQFISDAQVLSQIEALNQDFRMLNGDRKFVPDAFKKSAADARIMFCLSKVDPTGRPTSGIIKKYTTHPFFLGDDGMKFTSAGGSDAWDTKHYLNIWVCELFGRSLGYATPPGGPADKDGVVINYDVFGTVGRLRGGFNKGRTGTHEVAHWLGLKHIWGEDDCGDDGVKDTPKQKSYNFGCPVFPVISSCSPDTNGDMYMNFMDLTDDACMQLFTIGQKNKMRGLFALGAQRNAMLLSYHCDSSLASGAALPQDSLPAAARPITIHIFPNPVAGELNVQAGEFTTITGKTASLYTGTGRFLRKFLLQSEKEMLNLQSFPAGLYFLKIGDGAEQKTFKVIKI